MVLAFLCKALDDFAHQSCTVPLGNEEIQISPFHQSETPKFTKNKMINGVILLVFPRPDAKTLGT